MSKVPFLLAFMLVLLALFSSGSEHFSSLENSSNFGDGALIEEPDPECLKLCHLEDSVQGTKRLSANRVVQMLLDWFEYFAITEATILLQGSSEFQIQGKLEQIHFDFVMDNHIPLIYNLQIPS